MNKFLLLAVILVGVALLPAKAQIIDLKKIKFGAKASFNVSVFTNGAGSFHYPAAQADNLSSFRTFTRYSASGGVTADYEVSPAFSWSAELLYNSRGGAYSVADDGTGNSNANAGSSSGYDYFYYDIDYLQLPLLAKHDLTKPPAFTGFVIYGGLAPAVNVYKRTGYSYYDSNGYVAANSSAAGALEHVRSFNISAIAGFQMVGKRSVRKWYADFRGAYTLLPVFSSGGYFHTRMFTGSFGIGLKI